MSEQAIFQAIADPTRREIISLLASKPLGVNAISAHFDMTRPAVAKHLKILERGNLISVQAIGRERINHLEPLALKSIEDWLSHYSHFWDVKLSTLKSTIENKLSTETKS
ncbi:MAG: winged helix-turn-helix transcriptional regulator [Robiginitomaculum sp.]|nr:winged helix-turn-helix transcriptional regulator [Robiginitomaculum sp.]